MGLGLDPAPGITLHFGSEIIKNPKDEKFRVSLNLSCDWTCTDRHTQTDTHRQTHTDTHTYPQVPVGQVGAVLAGVGPVHRLLAVDLDDAAVLDVPRVLQLVEDVPGLVFDQQRRARGPGRRQSPEQQKKR